MLTPELQWIRCLTPSGCFLVFVTGCVVYIILLRKQYNIENDVCAQMCAIAAQNISTGKEI